MIAVAERQKMKGLVKVLSASEMARIEREAYTEGASDRAFMSAAGKGVADFVESFVKEHSLEWAATFLCGKGNNAGDAYVAAKHLLEMGYQLKVLQLAPMESSSALCQQMRAEFKEAGGFVTDCEHEEDIAFLDQGIILDGILGTGFRGQMRSLFAFAAEKANASHLPTIAIDIPSGINGNTGEGIAPAIMASASVTLGCPKRGCFVGEGWNHVGELDLVDFGLDPALVESALVDFWMVTRKSAAHLLPPIQRNRHKYEAGYVVGVAGSEGMPGAALLASESALRSGAGMMRLIHNFSESPHAVGAMHEVLHEPLKGAQSVLARLDKASALFIGPGLGKESAMVKLLEELLPKVDLPCVIDADGLAILSSHEIKLSKETILTPHRGEMAALLGKKPADCGGELEWLEACGKLAKERSVVLVLKGGPTFVFSPEGEVPYVVPFGDPGMATAGSGDVLTGILAALLAQGLSALNAALLGCAIHGMSGMRCAKRFTSYALCASDITRELPHIFRELVNRKRSNR